MKKLNVLDLPRHWSDLEIMKLYYFCLGYLLNKILANESN